MSVDVFLDRVYHRRRYNCLHHASEVWLALKGENIESKLADVLNGVKRAHVAAFRRLSAPADPCLVLMRRERSKTMHVGVMIAGRVLHIQGRGVEYQPLDVAGIGYTDIRFYT